MWDLIEDDWISSAKDMCSVVVVFSLWPASYFKGLAVGLGIGALAEVAKKSLRPEERNGKLFLHSHPFSFFVSFPFSFFFSPEATDCLRSYLKDCILMKVGRLVSSFLFNIILLRFLSSYWSKPQPQCVDKDGDIFGRILLLALFTEFIFS